MRAAGNLAAEHGWLVWNQGGSGDDVEAAHPGHVVSVLTPTSGYAVPFVRLLAAEDPRARLVVQHAPGSFGTQVADGATQAARSLGLGVSSDWPMAHSPAGWNLLQRRRLRGRCRTRRPGQNGPAPADAYLRCGGRSPAVRGLGR